MTRSNDFRSVTLGPEELAEQRHSLNGMDVYVEGRGAIRDHDLSGLSCRLLAFRGSSWLDEFVRARPRLRFSGCNFSGLSVDHLVFGRAAFHQCNFSGIEAKLRLGTDEVELVGCQFSGNLEGNISPSEGGTRKLQVLGNDFSRLRGVNFHDGVDWRSNVFDLGRTQLILDQNDAADSRVRAIFESTEGGQVITDSLIESRPINFGQSWTLLHQDDFDSTAWSQLVFLLAR